MQEIRPALYARISSDDNGRPELGVKRQQRSCEELAEREGWPSPAVYVDNNRSASCEVTSRPEFDRLCVDLAAGTVNRLIVLGQDRLCRKPEELELTMKILRKQGIGEIYTVKDGTLNIGSTQGRTLARVKGAFDIGYAEYISELCRLKKDELARDGVPSGGGKRPFGFEPGGMTVRAKEAKLIREAAARVLDGEGVQTICADWNRRGVRTVTGADWHPHVLWTILTIPRTAGLRQHRGEVAGEAAWPAILDRPTWERLRAVFRARRGKRVATNQALLTGLLRCGRCGENLNRSAPVYKCMAGPGRRGCGRLGANATAVEAWVTEEVIQALDSPALGAAVDAWRPPVVDVSAIEADLDRMAELRGAGTISEREWLAMRRPLLARLEQAQAQLAASATSPSVLAPYVGKPGLLRKRWPGLTIAQRRAIVAAVVDHITVAPGGRGRPFSPDRLSIVWRA
jgi:DNA invertase Pin-like site-specific DNA recombinase